MYVKIQTHHWYTDDSLFWTGTYFQNHEALIPFAVYQSSFSMNCLVISILKMPAYKIFQQLS